MPPVRPSMSEEVQNMEPKRDKAYSVETTAPGLDLQSPPLTDVKQKRPTEKSGAEISDPPTSVN